MVIGGNPGVGKTRLLREATGALDPRRHAIWSATASAVTSTLPFGSLATILPLEQTATIAPTALLRGALDALRAEADGRRIVLAIDDLHLADPLSAALVSLIARAESASVLATVRTGAILPEPVTAMWRDDIADRIELPPLGRAEVGELLRCAVGGSVDLTAAERLHRLTQGNAQLLRELVTEAQAYGDFTEVYGLWRWTGRPRLGPVLTELLDTRVGLLNEGVRAVVELVAFGEPLSLDLLTAAADAVSVEAAEERGLILVEGEGWQSTVRLTEPLYGELVRRRCPVTRARRILATLADLVERSGSPDQLRLAAWRLESQTTQDVDQLLSAGRQAFAHFDVVLAARLLTAAREAGSFEAAELLAWLYTMSGRASEGLQVIEDSRGEVNTDARRARWHTARAAVRNWGLRVDTAADELAAMSVRSVEDRAWMTGVEAVIRLHRAQSGRAAVLAQSVVDSADAQAKSRAVGRIVLAHLDALRGAATRSADDISAVEANAWQWRHEAPQTQLALELARGTGLILSADLSGVDALASAEYRRRSELADLRVGSAYFNVVMGQAARLRGRLNEAMRYQRTACGKVPGHEIFAGLAHAERAHVAALAGDRAEAELAIAVADRYYDPCMGVLYPWIEHARCWVRASGGDVDAAARMAHDLAARLHDDGFHAHLVIALHDLVRFGHPEQAVDRLGRLVGLVEGPLVNVMADHARAAAEGDGPQLLAVADSFGRLGLNLHGAEAAAFAFSRLRELRSNQASEATTLLARLLDRCEDSHTPGLIVDRPTLTAREAQIARLAAAGLTSKDIAGQLYLSARTIDNHLRRIYAKLGVSGRGELPTALSTLAHAAP